MLRPRKAEWSRFFCPEELCASPVFSWQRLSCQADSKIHGKLQRAKNSHARNRSRRLAEGNVGTLTRSGEAAAGDGRGGEARPRSQGPGRAEAHCGASPVSGLSPKEKNKEHASTLTPRHARIGSWQVTDLHVKVSKETGENVFIRWRGQLSPLGKSGGPLPAARGSGVCALEDDVPVSCAIRSGRAAGGNTVPFSPH